MAYQQCSKNIISFLQEKFPNKDWKNETKIQIHDTITDDIFRGLEGLCLDSEIYSKVFTTVYNGLTIANYRVPLIDIDIDPSLREFNEIDKNYDDCLIEEENGNYRFNLS